MKALVIHRGQTPGTPEGHAIAGFSMYRKELKERLGFTPEFVETSTLADVERAVLDHPADVAFIMVHWGERPELVQAMFERLNEMPNRPKLVLLDYCASTASPYYSVLPFVDRLAKRQMLKGPVGSRQKYEGGCLFTDFLAKNLGYDLQGWHFGSEADPAQAHKVVLGWNLGLSPKYRRLLRVNRALPVPWEWRRFALSCRLNTSDREARKDWYDQYRMMSLDSLTTVRKELRCTDTARIRRKHFIAELLMSKITFSPFGWGETCFRDFEAVCAGSLLLKPSMEHLRTSPDIYHEGKTYVACRWDLADVPDLCHYYLAHPREAKRIIANAQQAMSTYFESNGFVNEVSRVLDGVVALPTPAIPQESGAFAFRPISNPIARFKRTISSQVSAS